LTKAVIPLGASTIVSAEEKLETGSRKLIILEGAARSAL
jgi:hypothetical protein